MEKNKIIGICGGSASGKTTISKIISNKYQDSVTLLSQDSYYKSYDEYTLEQKKSINYDHPNAFDIELLERNLISLKNNCYIDCPIYSFSDYCRKNETIRITPKKIILLEGMLVLYYPKLRDLMDCSFYIDTSEDIRLERMIERDTKERGRTVKDVLEQYNRDMKPMHDKFVEPQKEYADVVIDGNNSIDIVLQDVIKSFQNMNIFENKFNRNNRQLIKKLF